jgi:hypothetical protein
MRFCPAVLGVEAGRLGGNIVNVSKLLRFLSFAALPVIVYGGGCSSTSTSTSGDDGGGGDGAVSHPEAGGGMDSGNPMGDDASPGGDSGLSDSTCAAEPLAQCAVCCQKVHPHGAMTFFQSRDSCLCTSPAVCKTECATELCAMKSAMLGDPCATCAQGALAQPQDGAADGPCVQPVVTACQADPDCVAFILSNTSCLAGCPNM